MAYAERADVLARAGRLSPAWDNNTTPGFAEIDRFLDDVAATIDAIIAAHGFSTPVTSEPTATALRPINAAGALLALLPGTFPGEGASTEVETLRSTVAAEYDAALDAMKAGGGVITVLITAAGSGLGNDFWTENPEYGRPGSPFVDPGATNPYLAPTIARTDSF